MSCTSHPVNGRHPIPSTVPKTPLPASTSIPQYETRQSNSCQALQNQGGMLLSETSVDDESIWRKHGAELVRYATVLVGPGHAEDVLSSVVVRTLRSKGSLSALDDARPYLIRAVLNEARNQRRRLRPWPTHLREYLWTQDVGPDVTAALFKLPARQRAAICLTHWRHLPFVETAMLMRCKPGTVTHWTMPTTQRKPSRLRKRTGCRQCCRDSCRIPPLPLRNDVAGRRRPDRQYQGS